MKTIYIWVVGTAGIFSLIYFLLLNGSKKTTGETIPLTDAQILKLMRRDGGGKYNEGVIKKQKLFKKIVLEIIWLFLCEDSDRVIVAIGIFYFLFI